MLFRWADGGNFRDLWKEHKRPELNYPRICWMAQQVYGLAHALDAIHNTKVTVSDVEAVQSSPLSAGFPQQSFESDHDSAAEDNEGSGYYGQHGNLRPEKVLWFKQDTSHHEFGILKLSGLGITALDRALTRGVAENGHFQTYWAPELLIEDSLSRPFDIWSLGCIFLEFLTWILLGIDGIDAFYERRLQDGAYPNPKVVLDNFFVLYRDDEAIFKARVKPSVSKVSSPLIYLRPSPDQTATVVYHSEGAATV